MMYLRARVAGCLIMACLHGHVLAVTVTENFNDDPYWAGFNNHVLSDSYGFSPATNFAGGAPGEAGGLFGRHDAFDSYYADIDLGGTLSVRDPIQSSGRISIDS